MTRMATPARLDEGWRRAPLEGRALFVVGVAVTVALVVRVAWALAGEGLLVTGGLALFVFFVGNPRVRLVAFYAFSLWLYLAVERITPALGTRPMDDVLLALDRLLLGETPATWWTPTGATADVLFACYGSYHLYLHGALLHVVVVDRGRGAARARALSRPLFLTFAIGLALYLVVPARGPEAAFPSLFPDAVVGGYLTDIGRHSVTTGTSVWDVFPSLHVAVTLAVLVFDFRYHRRRFWAVLVPALGLFVSTVTLRFHYAIDLVAGVLVTVLAFRLARWPAPGAE